MDNKPTPLPQRRAWKTIRRSLSKESLPTYDMKGSIEPLRTAAVLGLRDSLDRCQNVQRGSLPVVLSRSKNLPPPVIIAAVNTLLENLGKKDIHRSLE